MGVNAKIFINGREVQADDPELQKIQQVAGMAVGAGGPVVGQVRVIRNGQEMAPDDPEFNKIRDDVQQQMAQAGALQGLPPIALPALNTMLFGPGVDGDNANPWEPAGLPVSQLRTTIRRLQEKPGLESRQRLAMIKSVVRRGQLPLLPPPPPDYLPQYSLLDYLEYADYDANRDGVIDEAEGAAYLEAEKQRLAAKIQGFNAAMVAQFGQDRQTEEGEAAYAAILKELQGQRRQARDNEAVFVKTYDKNQDGRVDGEEYAVAVAEARERKVCEELMRLGYPQYDANGNFQLDADEYVLFKKEIVPKLDKNHDGRLDAEELAAAREEAMAQRQQQAQRQMQDQQQRGQRQQKQQEARYDLNGDGKLDAQERQRMQQDRNLQVAAPPLEE